MTTLADTQPAGWTNRSVGVRHHLGGLWHDHRVVLVFVAATLVVGVLVVALAGLLHGHAVAQFVGTGFALGAATLWLAAWVLLAPERASVSGPESTGRRHG